MKGTVVLGLCVLAGCSVGPTEPGEEFGGGLPEALQAAGEIDLGAPEPGAVDQEMAPDSPEYENAKMRMARAGRDDLGGPVALLPASYVPQVANAIVQDSGCLARNLPRNDDGSTSRIALPFSINFFGATYNSLYINNNGNVTFNSPMSTYTPFTINARTPPIIAPFFADVDTRSGGSGIVTYSNTPIVFEGRRAFCVNWVGVGYYSYHADKLNSFQLLLVDRNDTGAGNFDIVMNHNQILWETGDASGGSGGYGGTPAGAGFSAGNGNPAAFFQFPGSLVRSGFLDSNAATGLSRTSHFSNVIGRHIFGVRYGQPVVDELISLNPTSATREPGQSHTVTATLINDRSQPLPNRPVTFRIVSGPNSGVPPTTVNTDSTGRASFTYVGAGGPGQDQLQASFVKSTGATAVSDPVTATWVVTARPPVALCRSTSVAAGNTCGVGASIDNGSYDPDGDLVGCTQSPGPIYGLGSTLVTLTCTDARGNTAHCTGTVTVTDTIAPSITCPANRTAECVAGAATVALGPAFASDNCGSVSVSNPGTASYPLGTTPVDYTATDSSGNSSVCTARVTVADTLAPSVSLNGSAAPVLECGVNAYTEPGATASDQCAGNVSSTVTIYGSVNAGSVGVYNLAYTASDPAGHVSPPAFRSVTVRDTLAPTLVLSGANPQRLECGIDSYQEAGATAQDACSGNLSASVAITGTVNASQPGVYTLGYGVTDGAGNSATQTRTVTVADTTPPQVTVAPAVQIWPPNHSMLSLRLSDCASVTDACGGDGDIDAMGTITSVYSDEPEDALGNGDGHTTGDIVITGNATFALRAEREGRGNGRVYGVSFTVTDGSGNTRAATCQFAVPHDQSGTPAVDDGSSAGYTVPAASASVVVAPR